MGNVNMDSSQIHYKKSAEFNNVESALTQALQNGSEVSIEQAVTSGTELATVTIDGTGTKIYAPTIPPTKHLEWVTVASGTENTSYVSQLTELYTAYIALPEYERINTRLFSEGSIYIYQKESSAAYVDTYTGATALHSVMLRLVPDVCARRCDISVNNVTFSDIGDTIASSISLQVLRLVDNV